MPEQILSLMIEQNYNVHLENENSHSWRYASADVKEKSCEIAYYTIVSSEKKYGLTDANHDLIIDIEMIISL